MNVDLRQFGREVRETHDGFNDWLGVFSGAPTETESVFLPGLRFTPLPHKLGGLFCWCGGVRTERASPWTNAPVASPHWVRPGNVPGRSRRIGFDSQHQHFLSPLRVGMFRLQPYGVEFNFLPAVQKQPNTTAISGSAPERIEFPWTTPGPLATETGQSDSEAIALNSGKTNEYEHTLAGCPSDRVLTKALGEQSSGTAEKINRTLSGNSLLLTLEYLDVCTGTRAFCRYFASEGF